MANLLNFFLQDQIRNKNFDYVSELLRNNSLQGINSDTWNMLADHLQGKLRRRKGRPSDPEILDRNRQAWEYHQELTRERRLSYEAAIAAMAEEYEEVDPEKEASNYEGMLRGWIDAYSRVRKGLDSP